MMFRKVMAAAVAIFWFAVPSFSQSATPEGLVDKWAQAWNSHDASAFEKLFTADAHLIVVYDSIIEGRANIVADFKVAQEGWAKAAKATTSKVSVQHLSRKIAAVYFNVMIEKTTPPPAPGMGRTVQFVVVKERDGWRISSLQLSKPNCPGFLAQYKQPVESGADRKKIDDIVQKWPDDWNQHDIKALATLLAENADVVTVTGTRLRSRKEFEEDHTESHAGILKESTLRTNHGVEVKFIRPDIAIVHGERSITGVKELDGTPRPPQKVRFTWVLEKRNELWSIIAAQHTFVR